MSIEELRAALQAIRDRQTRQELERRERERQTGRPALGPDIEQDHLKADALLLDYINDEEVYRIFDSISRHYS